MKHVLLTAAALVCAGVFAAASGRPPRAPHTAGPETVARVLDDFHDAASRADEKRYFGYFAEDGVFLGTDAGERWSKKEFLAYAKPYFDQGRGWTYFPRAGKRFITIATDGTTAWFDEVLDNAKYGECRGTGVLVRKGEDWKIAQYNLTVPIPNDLLEKVAGMIKEQQKKPGK